VFQIDFILLFSAAAFGTPGDHTGFLRLFEKQNGSQTLAWHTIHVLPFPSEVKNIAISIDVIFTTDNRAQLYLRYCTIICERLMLE
jgi:hypothetical protein